MNKLTVDLSPYPERFLSKQLELAKSVNFIFGKNGTGKSTITDQIKDQFSSDFSVKIFQDFEGITKENGRLNAIALGEENAEIQIQIDEIDEQIAELKASTSKPIDGDKRKNLYTENQCAKKAYDSQFQKVEYFYKDTASKIKKETKPQIASTSYNIRSIKDELSNAKLLSDDEIRKNKATIKAEQKANIVAKEFPKIQLLEYLKAVNEILVAHVSQPESIPELVGKSEKESFAKMGMRIHTHQVGEKCVFCGNEISEERWDLLAKYFNNEVEKLNERIKNGIQKIEIEKAKIEAISELKTSDFYPEFREKTIELNLAILNKKKELVDFFDKLSKKLDDKKKAMFIAESEISFVIPEDFTKIKTDCETLITSNNDFSRNLATNQEGAKDALRYHKIKRALEDFQHETKLVELTELQKSSDQAAKNLKEKIDELIKKREKRSELVMETQDEEKIANKINKSLSKMGFSSFTLELVNDEESGQKGQYQIRGHQSMEGKLGELRTIEELSKGEKNIIAFLYFIFALEVDEESSKNKIVVFDDPMTSNDDTMQYLMISEFQNLLKRFKNSDDCLILLTHNVHFYLNAQHNPLSKNYKPFGHFHLLTSNYLTEIKMIDKESDDFKTNYEMLWKELHFLFEHQQPDLMLGCCRRICENFKEFTCKTDFYKENSAAKKLFDVNQHFMYDSEAEPNGKTAEEIIEIMKNLFDMNDSLEHFRNHWSCYEEFNIA